jgi:hypothetical protein
MFNDILAVKEFFRLPAQRLKDFDEPHQLNGVVVSML